MDSRNPPVGQRQNESTQPYRTAGILHPERRLHRRRHRFDSRPPNQRVSNRCPFSPRRPPITLRRISSQSLTRALRSSLGPIPRGSSRGMDQSTRPEALERTLPRDRGPPQSPLVMARTIHPRLTRNPQHRRPPLLDVRPRPIRPNGNPPRPPSSRRWPHPPRR